MPSSFGSKPPILVFSALSNLHTLLIGLPSPFHSGQTQRDLLHPLAKPFIPSLNDPIGLLPFETTYPVNPHLLRVHFSLSTSWIRLWNAAYHSRLAPGSQVESAIWLPSEEEIRNALLEGAYRLSDIIRVIVHGPEDYSLNEGISSEGRNNINELGGSRTMMLFIHSPFLVSYASFRVFIVFQNLSASFVKVDCYVAIEVLIRELRHSLRPFTYIEYQKHLGEDSPLLAFNNLPFEKIMKMENALNFLFDGLLDMCLLFPMWGTYISSPPTW